MDEGRKKLEDTVKRVHTMVAGDRWFLDNNLLTESLQQNLIAFGYGAHLRAEKVELSIDIKNKKINYLIKLPEKYHKRYLKFLKKRDKYKKSNGIWSKWRLIRLLNKNKSMDIEKNLQKCVTDYIPGYTVTVETKGMATFWLKIIKKLMGV